MSNQIIGKVDYITVLLYAILVLLGWSTIYSTTVPIDGTSMFDFSATYGRQLTFIGVTIPIIFIILLLESKTFERLSFVFYLIGIIMLLGLFVFGSTVKGQTNWYKFGGFGLQPSEFVKTAVALLLSKFLSYNQVNLKSKNQVLIAFAIIGLPILLILAQPDMGSAMIFVALFFVLHRFGLNAWFLISGFAAIILFFLALNFNPYYVIDFLLLVLIIIVATSKKIKRTLIPLSVLWVIISGFVLFSNTLYNSLEPHQKDRIDVVLGKEVNLKKEGYNLNQSKIAIGSGGWFGKGFLEGTQTKGGFVPEQHTDYIFTTIGEEWGFIGTLTVIGLFLALFFRILYLAERQKTKFAKVYGYCLVTYLFIHFFVNIAMLIGLFPTIGVPLPFFSYGGSSLIAFTIMLFIFVKLDANQVNEW
jgi:rod shape determining protein RodA